MEWDAIVCCRHSTWKGTVEGDVRHSYYFHFSFLFVISSLHEFSRSCKSRPHLSSKFSEGTLNGTVIVQVELRQQLSPLRNLEWAGPHSLLSAGYNHALSSTNLVRNDLVITDIRTGTVVVPMYRSIQYIC